MGGSMCDDVTERIWDTEVQAFIAACMHRGLHNIELKENPVDGDGSLLQVDALYRSRRGALVPVRLRWERYDGSWAPFISVGNHSCPVFKNHHDYYPVARQARLWWERRTLGAALLGLAAIYVKAHAVRGQLHAARLREARTEERALPGLVTAGDTEIRMAETQQLTLATLNDLAYLYGSRIQSQKPDLD
jgi:hypothetical protein